MILVHGNVEKAEAFTHIPTNFMILTKINSSINHKGK